MSLLASSRAFDRRQRRSLLVDTSGEDHDLGSKDHLLRERGPVWAGKVEIRQPCGRPGGQGIHRGTE